MMFRFFGLQEQRREEEAYPSLALRGEKRPYIGHVC